MLSLPRIFAVFILAITLVSAHAQQPESAIRRVEWKSAAMPGQLFADWSGFSVRPGLSVARATTPEGEAATARVEANTRNALVPINIELPPNTKTLGLWLRDSETEGGPSSAEAASLDITVQIVRDDKTENIKLTRQLAATPNSNAQNAGFTPFAKENGWIQRRAFFPTGEAQASRRIVLRSFRINGVNARKLEFGPILSSSQNNHTALHSGILPSYLYGNHPTTARMVWKMKDFQELKPVSNNWTGTQFYEYGYETVPALRATAWKRLLTKPGAPGTPADAAAVASVASLRVIIRTANGMPRVRYTRSALESALLLPDMTEGSYFLQLSGFDAAGVLVAEAPFVFQMLRHDLAFPVVPDGEILPFVINGVKYDGPSGSVGQKLDLSLAANFEIKTPLRAEWKILDGADKLQAQGRGELPTQKATIPITFTPPTSGAYRLDISFFNAAGALVDRTRETIGVAASSEPNRAATTLTLPAGVAPETGQPLMLGTAQVLFEAGQTHRLPQTELPSLLNWTREAGLTPTIVINWNELEPVPGCFAWHLLDRVLDQAGEGGAFIGLRFAGDLLPEWLWFEELLSHNQQTINAEYHYSSPLGPRLRPALDRAWTAIADRYRDNPRVRGYFTAAGPSEGFLTDGSSVVSDYSPPAREAFREALRKRYESLEKLNAAWGANYKSWEDVQPPLPNWDLAWESSRAWWDWHRFKQEFTNTRVDEMQKTIRTTEPQRPMTMYARQGFGATGELAPVFASNNFRYINGGGESAMSYVQMSIMRGHGVPVTVEGHAVMPNLGSVNWVLLNSVLSGFGGNNVQMGAVWSKTPHRTPEYAAVQALQKRFAAIAPELSKAQLETNWAGFYSNVHTMLRTRSFRNGGYAGVSQLNTLAQETLHQPCAWVDDNSDPKLLARYPLIVDAGATVLAPEAVRLLHDYAQNGGTLVIGATTGRFSPGNPEPTDALLKAFGATTVIPKPTLAANTPATPLRTENSKLITPTRTDRFDIRWNQSALPKVIYNDPATGGPLAWQLPYGRGQVIVVAGTLHIPQSANWLRALVHQYAGKPTVEIETPDNAVAGLLHNPQTNARYLALLPAPARRALEDYNLTRTQIAATGKAALTLRGPFKTGTFLENLADGSRTPVTQDGQVSLQVQRGVLHLWKLP